MRRVKVQRQSSLQFTASPGHLAKLAAVEVEAPAARAQLNMLLLAVVQRGPVSGRAVKDYLRLATGGKLDPSDGTVYPALRRLEHLGLLASSWSAAGGQQFRVFELTQAGQDRLSAERRAWSDYVSMINELLDPQTSVNLADSSPAVPPSPEPAAGHRAGQAHVAG